MIERLGIESVQQFYDHVANTPGEKPAINRSSVLKGKVGAPKLTGFSRTVHYEVSGAGRIDYQYCDAFTGGAQGDAHPVVFVLAIDLSSH